MLDQTAPHHLLADLKHQRATLDERLATLGAVGDRLRAAEGDEAAALAAIGDLGRSEAEAAKRWAAAGATGDLPPLDHQKRAELNRALAVASATAEAARAATADVDGQIAAATRESAALAGKIDAAAHGVLAEAYRVEHAELVTAAAELRGRFAGTLALLTVMQDQADAMRDAGRHDEARPLLTLMASLRDLPPPDIAPTVAEVHGAAPAWSARLQELTR